MPVGQGEQPPDVTKTTPTPAAGVQLGRYKVESELGRGGMGVVYACMDEALGRRVAVKTLSVGLLGRDREARISRFQREVKALSQLDHAGILHIYDADEADDSVIGWVLYYAMELVEGETLSERLIRGGAMERAAACAVVQKCAEALGTAHQRGIVHRDVKPANIFLAGGGRVVVADFGVCKIEGGTEITRKDQMVGTPSYLAPEQILGLPVDPRTDVFALGALLYVLITNSALRPQLDRAGLSRLAATDDAATRARAVKGLPEGLPDIIARALARDPKDRFASGAELAEALEAFAGRVPDPFENPSDPNVPVVNRQGAGLGGGTLSAFTSGNTGPSGETSSPALQAPRPAAAEEGGDTIAEGVEPAALRDERNATQTVAGALPSESSVTRASPVPQDPPNAGADPATAEATDRLPLRPKGTREAMRPAAPRGGLTDPERQSLPAALVADQERALREARERAARAAEDEGEPAAAKPERRDSRPRVAAVQSKADQPVLGTSKANVPVADPAPSKQEPSNANAVDAPKVEPATAAAATVSKGPSLGVRLKALGVRLKALPPWAHVALAVGGLVVVSTLAGVVARPSTTPDVPVVPPVEVVDAGVVAQPEPTPPPKEVVPAVCTRQPKGTPNYREVEGLKDKAHGLEKKGQWSKAVPLWTTGPSSPTRAPCP